MIGNTLGPYRVLEKLGEGGLSQGNRHTYPCWSPDGTRIAYMKVGAPSGVCGRSLDGAGGESPLWVTPGNTVRGPESWHPMAPGWP